MADSFAFSVTSAPSNGSLSAKGQLRACSEPSLFVTHESPSITRRCPPSVPDAPEVTPPTCACPCVLLNVCSSCEISMCCAQQTHWMHTPEREWATRKPVDANTKEGSIRSNKACPSRVFRSRHWSRSLTRNEKELTRTMGCWCREDIGPCAAGYVVLFCG